MSAIVAACYDDALENASKAASEGDFYRESTQLHVAELLAEVVGHGRLFA